MIEFESEAFEKRGSYLSEQRSSGREIALLELKFGFELI